ncbi:MAG: alpha/beta hydrolase [Pseudomonadota bacterium]
MLAHQNPVRAIDQLKSELRKQSTTSDLNLSKFRKGTVAVAHMNPPAPDVQSEVIVMGSVQCRRVSVPGFQPDRRLIYFHGGGFVSGSSETHLAIAGELSRYGRCQVICPDYRLAPEHPFPAAYDDALAVVDACLMSADHKMVLSGDSAGGGLALSAACHMRDRNPGLLTGVLLLCPWLDLDCAQHRSTQSYDVGDPLLTWGLMEQLAFAYLQGADVKDVRSSPINLDLSGLAPVYIQAGENDILKQDAINLSGRLANSQTELRIWPEMIHVWHAFSSILPEANEALQKAGDWLNNYTQKGRETKNDSSKNTPRLRLVCGHPIGAALHRFLRGSLDSCDPC